MVALSPLACYEISRALARSLCRSGPLQHYLLPLTPDAALCDFVGEIANDHAVFMAFAVKPAREQLPRFEFNGAAFLDALENLRIIGTAEAGRAKEGLM